MLRNKPKLHRAALACFFLTFAIAAPGAGGRWKPAHNLTFEDVNPRSPTHGQKVELKSLYDGRGVVLQFVASWCKPCRDDLPHVQALAASGRSPVVLVAADEGPAGIENILIVAERAGLTVPLLFVPPESVAEVESHFGHDVLPATYFLDHKGRIRSMYEGALTPVALDKEVAAVIKPPAG